MRHPTLCSADSVTVWLAGQVRITFRPEQERGLGGNGRCLIGWRWAAVVATLSVPAASLARFAVVQAVSASV